MLGELPETLVAIEKIIERLRLKLSQNLYTALQEEWEYTTSKEAVEEQIAIYGE